MVAAWRDRFGRVTFRLLIDLLRSLSRWLRAGVDGVRSCCD